MNQNAAWLHVHVRVINHTNLPIIFEWWSVVQWTTSKWVPSIQDTQIMVHQKKPINSLWSRTHQLLWSHQRNAPSDHGYKPMDGEGGLSKTNDCLVTVSWCLWLIMHVTSAVWWMSFLKQNHKFFLYPILWAGSHTINPPKVNGTILCCSDSILHLATSIKYYGDWCRTVKMVKLNSQALTLVQWASKKWWIVINGDVLPSRLHTTSHGACHRARLECRVRWEGRKQKRETSFPFPSPIAHLKPCHVLYEEGWEWGRVMMIKDSQIIKTFHCLVF